ncbi:Phosphopantetheine adenylyltransferase [Trametes pubescens]|uniref:Phosphopantetheine adenylyltransferase n=1 Tax=Trametes pubescens TaxID=154538 RepID=A0A1M2VNH5_TRAPU|nr:Phosphopantetheine adenylyltransferase [Trametes pubescens]
MSPALTSSLKDVQHTLLLTTVHNLHDAPNFLAAPVSTAARTSTQGLRIVILSPFFDLPPDSGSGSDGTSRGLSRTAHWDDVQRLLTFVYVQATKVAQDLGNILLDIDVLLRGTAVADAFPERVALEAERIFSGAPDITILAYMPLLSASVPAVVPPDTHLPALPAALQKRSEEIIPLEPDVHSHSAPPASPPVDPSVPPLYPVVALGGTFDHLHAGHKILLSMGAWIARRKLIVGITGDALLGKKEHRSVLEPLPVRTARTRTFLELFRPGIVHDLVPINDVFGPTGWDADIQALVVSKETLSGASSIAKRREEQALPPLRTFVIDVISATEASVDAEDAAVLRTAKMSSTYIREWIVKNQKQETQASAS